MRLILAIQAFFALLFGGKLPLKALPPPTEPEDKKLERERLAKELETAQGKLEELEASNAELSKAKDELTKATEELTKAKGELTQQLADSTAASGGVAKELEETKTNLEASQSKVEKLKSAQSDADAKLTAARDDGVLALMAWLQREGRLLDFLKEDIDDADDEQVGAAVRAIHKGCLKVIDEGFTLEAILPGEEDSQVEVPAGFDSVAIQLSGNVKGDPPFKGTLMHPGWRASRVSVPVPETVDTHVLAPAEVEL